MACSLDIIFKKVFFLFTVEFVLKKWRFNLKLGF